MFNDNGQMFNATGKVLRFFMKLFSAFAYGVDLIRATKYCDTIILT